MHTWRMLSKPVCSTLLNWGIAMTFIFHVLFFSLSFPPCLYLGEKKQTRGRVCGHSRFHSRQRREKSHQVGGEHVTYTHTHSLLISLYFFPTLYFSLCFLCWGGLRSHHPLIDGKYLSKAADDFLCRVHDSCEQCLTVFRSENQNVTNSYSTLRATNFTVNKSNFLLLRSQKVLLKCLTVEI